MKYLIDIHAVPAVVVLQTRTTSDDGLAEMALAQRYADQTGHTLVVASGPDAVLNPDDLSVVHPTQHKAVAQEATPIAGVNLAPVAPRSAIAGDLSAVWKLLESLEPAAIDILSKMFSALVSKK